MAGEMAEPSLLNAETELPSRLTTHTRLEPSTAELGGVLETATVIACRW